MERIHIYQKGKPNRPVLLLLHGTGGTEGDLIPMAARLDPDAGLLSLRGDVIEDGHFRHFRRLAPGVFDEADLITRTEGLKQFIDWASAHYGFDRNWIVAFGYSNGANLAASHLLRHPGSLSGAMLLHPLSAGKIDHIPNLNNLPIFIGAGHDDPLCPVQKTEALEALIKKAGADVTTAWFNFGHHLSKEELDAAASWYQKHFRSFNK